MKITKIAQTATDDLSDYGVLMKTMFLIDEALKSATGLSKPRQMKMFNSINKIAQIHEEFKEESNTINPNRN